MAELTEEQRQKLLAAAAGAREAPGGLSAEDVARLRREASDAAVAQFVDGAKRDGSDFFLDPDSGAMTSRELLANRMQPGALDAGVVGAGQGVSFGAMDEAVGGLNAIIPGAGSMGDRYTFGREWMRAANEAARRDHSGAALTGEILGAGATGLMTGGAALPGAGAGLGTRMAASAGMGAGEGMFYGFAAGEGGLQPRATDALKTGLVGASIGAAVPPTISAAKAIGGRLARPFAAAAGIGDKGRARSAVARAIRNSGRGMDDIDAYLRRAADDGQGVAIAADALGHEGRATLAGATRQPGPARNTVIEMLEQRQRDQGDRLARLLRDNLGLDDTAALEGARLATSRADDAGVNYAAARASAKPVDVSRAVSTIDDLLGRDPIVGEATSLADTAIGRKLARFRKMLATSDDTLIDFDRVKEIRTDLREFLDQNPRARATFGQAYTDLTDALADASDDFRFANDAYREASGVIDALDTGKRLNAPGQRYEDVAATYSRLSDPEKAAARASFADKELARIENARPGTNKVDPLRSTRQMENLRLMADDPDRVVRGIELEADMFDTRHKVVGGSQTAELAADQGAVNGADVGIIANLISGRPGAASGQALGRFLQGAQGLNEGTRAEIARLLTTRAPGELSGALATGAARDAATRNVAETMLRRNIIAGTGKDTRAREALEAMLRKALAAN